MALAPKTTYKYDPTGGTGYKVATNALERWLNEQKKAGAQFTAAAAPLQQAVQLFQPGGGYGAGQTALLQDQAKQAQAQALSNQVASGMSSGSLATSTGLRVKSDLAKNLAGVEDTRTQFLNQALQALAGLKQTQAQTTAGTVDPTLNAFLSYLGQSEAIGEQGAQNVLQVNAAAQLAADQAAAQAKKANTIPTSTKEPDINTLKF